MSYTHKIILCSLMLACCSVFFILPAHAFTANSLDITIDKDGDAVATFRFTLEGIIENAIPQSILEEELKKGLTTSSEPPELKSMDRSSAVLLLKNFAGTSDVPTGTGYLTATMDFKKAEIALQNSAISGAVSADFSPAAITLTFPDAYRQEFSNVDVLPAVFHTVVDPSKTPQTPAPGSGGTPAGESGTSATKGSMNVTSSPQNVKVYLDSVYIGEAPAIFREIASGTHIVEFRKEGFESATKNVSIIAGKTTSVLVVLRYIPTESVDDTASLSWLPLMVVIIGIVAVVAGGYYYWSEKKKKAWGVGEDFGAEDTGMQKPAVREKVPEKPVVREPEVKNTVTRVTILRDIPDKKTEDTGTKDKPE
jgi:hypothetical protein